MVRKSQGYVKKICLFTFLVLSFRFYQFRQMFECQFLVTDTFCFAF